MAFPHLLFELPGSHAPVDESVGKTVPGDAARRKRLSSAGGADAGPTGITRGLPRPEGAAPRQPARPGRLDRSRNQGLTAASCKGIGATGRGPWFRFGSCEADLVEAEPLRQGVQLGVDR